MSKPLDILVNVLKLEKRKGFTNSSVSGGMNNFIEFIERPDLQASISQENQEILKKFFGLYDSFGINQRKILTNEILEWAKNANTSKLEVSICIEEEEISKLKAIHNSESFINRDQAIFASIKKISGVGERNSKFFERLGIKRIIDLLRYFPRRYQDFSLLKTIAQIEFGDELSVIGSVSQEVFIRDSRSGRLKIIETSISDGSGTLRLIWFNKPFLKNQLYIGMPIVVSGKIDTYMGRLVMTNSEWEPLDSDQLHTNRIVPIYPLTTGISQKQIRKIIGRNLPVWNRKVNEYFNDVVLETEKLITIREALKQIHFPDSEDHLNLAKKRFAFEEIFFLQLGVLIQRRNWVEASARKYSLSTERIKNVRQSLPYELTNSQKKAVNDIFEDLNSGKPMNRLLQGDVGSGKTVVAHFAMEAIVNNQAQAAIMAPTSILAEQHYQTLSQLFINAKSLDQDEIALLTGDTPIKDRQWISEGLNSGKIKVIIGTHTLLEEPVVFNDLQIVVIDEQHRFGVQQRKTLRDKGESPHLLVMTATPIPRSLAMTVYGDLDVSVIDEMPAGRIPVETVLLHNAEREKAYQLVREEVKKGFQAFIIYPLVRVENEDEDKEFTAAVNEHKRLSEKIFTDLRVGLVHGKLRQSEKDEIMYRFRKGDYDVLVSTTVIEVGVDIPNATVVLIEGANRFGLAQLHQLRGRVGRNSQKSYCLLIPDGEDKQENERLSAMVRSNDGFELADIDLKLRGPGEFLGTRQSGYLTMHFANLTDLETISRCREYVKSIFENDPRLEKNEHLLLAEQLKYHWPDLNLS